MLYTIGIVLVLISVSTFYYSATKIEINKNKLILQLGKQKLIVRILGIISGLGSVYFFQTQISMLAAIFSVLVLWMVIASLLTLFAPSIKVFAQYFIALFILVSLFSII